MEVLRHRELENGMGVESFEERGRAGDYRNLETSRNSE